jgi:hypothetical protein
MNRAAWDLLVDQARSADLLEIAASVGTTLHREGAEHVGPCPICGGDDRFSINTAKGVFFCRGCVKGGSGAIDLQIFLDGGDFVTAVKTLTGTESLVGKHTAPADAKAKADKRRRDQAEHEAEQHRKASWLWSQSQPIEGSIAEKYLREARGISGPLPATLRFLPARDTHASALIAAFALPHELEPGMLVSPQHVDAVHLVKLTGDGSDRLREPKAKISIGAVNGRPIVVAPVNDLGGLAICEGIEDGLTAHCATGLGAWASASAPFLPKLAATVPAYVEVVTIFAHNDGGLPHAKQLADQLRAKGVEVTLEVSS